MPDERVNEDVAVVIARIRTSETRRPSEHALVREIDRLQARLEAAEADVVKLELGGLFYKAERDKARADAELWENKYNELLEKVGGVWPT